jgi:ATP-dependent Clp protease adaptor protein ClpS
MTIEPDLTTQIHEDADAATRTARPWVVVLYNDDWHGFDEVVLQIQKATGKSEVEAHAITHEAHNKGKAIAFTGDLEKCQGVAAVLRQIQLQVDVDDP